MYKACNFGSFPVLAWYVYSFWFYNKGQACGGQLDMATSGVWEIFILIIYFLLYNLLKIPHSLESHLEIFSSRVTSYDISQCNLCISLKTQTDMRWRKVHKCEIRYDNQDTKQIKTALTMLTCCIEKYFSLCMLWEIAKHVWRKIDIKILRTSPFILEREPRF